jgi:hypothetical protein
MNRSKLAKIAAKSTKGVCPVMYSLSHSGADCVCSCCRLANPTEFYEYKDVVLCLSCYNQFTLTNGGQLQKKR